MSALRFARPGSARAALAVLAVAALAGCAPAPGTPGVSAPGPTATGYVKTVHPEEVDLWRGVHYQGLVLDVRNPDEWDDTPGLLDGATRIPLGELEARLPEVVAWRSKPALVFDATGPRAQAGAQLLARNGFVDVGWMEGGLEAYRRAQSQR